MLPHEVYIRKYLDIFDLVLAIKVDYPNTRKLAQDVWEIENIARM